VQRKQGGRGEHEPSTSLEYEPHIRWQTT
jgi:hypothetical protein